MRKRTCFAIFIASLGRRVRWTRFLARVAAKEVRCSNEKTGTGSMVDQFMNEAMCEI